MLDDPVEGDLQAWDGQTGPDRVEGKQLIEAWGEFKSYQRVPERVVGGDGRTAGLQKPVSGGDSGEQRDLDSTARHVNLQRPPAGVHPVNDPAHIPVTEQNVAGVKVAMDELRWTGRR